MRVVIVDDEKLAIKQFELESRDIEDVDIAASFCNPEEALAYMKEHQAELVLLDIEMPGMNGIVLARKIREIWPDIVVIFITGYEDYAVDALKIKADYYLMKPYNRSDIEEVIERARLLSKRQKKRVYMKTFGRFDVFIDEKAVHLANAKAKELLALCVDHRGGSVTIEEAIDKLWEGRTYDERVKNLYRKAVMSIRKVFKDHELEEIFISNRGACNINDKKVDCDYYDLLAGKSEAVREYNLLGDYLSEYSWAEETAARIQAQMED